LRLNSISAHKLMYLLNHLSTTL